MLDANAQELLMSEYPADCCPVRCYIHFPCMAGEEDSPFWQGWAALRIKTFRLVENKYFETAVIAMILLSSLALVRLYNLYIFYYLLSGLTPHSSSGPWIN
jgi:voltage-gated sodium channel type II alpha